MTGFISSPFIEDNLPWPMRQKIRFCLEQMGHQPWTWEVEGKLAQEKDLSRKSTDIISEAIRKSNLIVVVYKTRAGSPFNDELIPVLATEFEVIEAIRFNIPILFYIISNSAREKELDNTISVFGNKVILNDRPINCKDEESLIERFRLDVENLNYRSTKIIHPLSKNWMDSDDLNSMQEIIYANFYVGEFGLALGMIENYSLVKYFSPRTKDEKVLLAKYWGHCGKIYAHSRKYKKAIQVVRRSIRLLMECGYYTDMFYQIEALSGILTCQVLTWQETLMAMLKKDLNYLIN